MNPNKIFIITLLLAILLMQCTDASLLNPFGKEATALDIVTGITLRDQNGTLTTRLGNPNARVSNSTFFPNPANNSIMVVSSQPVVKIWFLQAEKNDDFKDLDFNEALANEDFDTDELERKSELIVTPIGQNFTVSTSLLISDYYRVFILSANGSLELDNLYIDREHTFEESVQILQNAWSE